MLAEGFKLSLSCVKWQSAACVFSLYSTAWPGNDEPVYGSDWCRWWFKRTPL